MTKALFLKVEGFINKNFYLKFGDHSHIITVLIISF